MASKLANFIDRAIETFAPRAAANRMAARRRITGFSALGAYANDGRPNTQVGQVGEVLRTNREQVQLMLNALNLIDNSGLASSITDKFGVYTFGNLRWQARSGDDAVNDEHEAYMRERLGTSIDITGRYCFREMAQIAMRGCIVKGGVGFDIIRPDPTHPHIYLRGIEYDRIGNPYYTGAQQFVVNGVHIDELGREVSFDIYDRDRVGGMYRFAENIPKYNLAGGQEFMHIFRPGSGGFDQYKGTTAFKTAIDDVYYLDMIRRYELQAQQWAAAQSGVFYTDDKSIPPVGVFDDRTNPLGQSQSTFKVTPGVVSALGTGERVEMFKNERPSANVQAMWLNVVRNIALSVGLPYIFVYDGDGGGPGVRFAGAQADRTIQDWFQMFDERFLSPSGNAILRNGIFVEKAIPYHPGWNRGRWLGPSRLSIDAGYDSAAALNEIAEGIRTRTDVSAQFGFDGDEVDSVRRREVTRTIQNAQKIAKETGADFDLVLSLLLRNQNASAGTGGVAAQITAADAKSEDELSRGASSDGVLMPAGRN